MTLCRKAEVSKRAFFGISSWFGERDACAIIRIIVENQMKTPRPMPEEILDGSGSFITLPEEWRLAIEPSEPDYPSLEQFVTPVDDGYVALVGQAAFAFVPGVADHQLGAENRFGFINDVSHKTAGAMAKTFAQKIIAFGGDPSLKTELAELADRFSELVSRRNDLLHAHPATIRGEQRLHYWSVSRTFTWEPDDIVSFAHETEALANKGNALYYDRRMPA